MDPMTNQERIILDIREIGYSNGRRPCLPGLKRFLKKTGRNLISMQKTDGIDRQKFECYNCHRRVETPANALVVQDGIGGYDWSF
ncbi:hypothetical protein Tco_0295047 [Tanacetum coccineum]